MPLYVYQGLNTGETFEVEQRISEPALTHNPTTGEPIKRLIGRPAIAFKGSGFYANDSRSGGSSLSSGKPEGTSESGSASPSESSNSSKTESAPSSTPASTPAPAAKASSSGE